VNYSSAPKMLTTVLQNVLTLLSQELPSEIRTLVYEQYGACTQTYLTHPQNGKSFQDGSTGGQPDPVMPHDQLVCIENNDMGGVHCSGLLGANKQVRDEFSAVLARLQTLQLSGNYSNSRPQLLRYDGTSLSKLYLNGLRSVKLHCGLRALNRFGKGALRYHPETIRKYLPDSVRDFTLDVHDLRPPALQKELDILTYDNEGACRQELKESLNDPSVLYALKQEIYPVMRHCPGWFITSLAYKTCRATITISFLVDYAGRRWKILNLEISRISLLGGGKISDWKPVLSYSEAFLDWAEEGPTTIQRSPS
jgi:hypothetical protein